MKADLVVLTAAAAAFSLAAAAQTATQSDQWALGDPLGRSVTAYDAARPKSPEKLVGMFYWLWHPVGYPERTDIAPVNITEARAAYPNAMSDPKSAAWGERGKRPDVYYWEQPLFGYYHTTDPWVLRKHAEMLADAGVDVVFFDNSNGTFTWREGYTALFEVWQQALDDGVRVPKVAFLLPFAGCDYARTQLKSLYDDIYKPGRYKDLWMMWDGKPLILAYPNSLYPNTEPDETIRKFFTFRPCQPDYVNGPQLNGSPEWGWLENYPQHGYTRVTGRQYEECPVGVAQNASAARGGHCCAFSDPDTYSRSYTKSHGRDTRENSYLYGANFQEQWDRAIDKVKPRLVFVTGWNEWVSGLHSAADGWSDPVSFVDQYSWDCSRDIEPVKAWGDCGDVYYVQLVNNVRRFKGMDAPAEASGQKTIVLGADAAQWADVEPRYTAYKGNALKRDHRGRFNTYYEDFSARNDITGAQVACDARYVYFRVETAEPLTAPCSNWMELFVDTDRSKQTGWQGYDLVVNSLAPAGGKAFVQTLPGAEWNPQGGIEIPMSAAGNALELAIPRELFGQSEDGIEFEFKWADNLQKPGDVMDFYVSGDVAPGGRFNYVYINRDASGSGIAAPAASAGSKTKVGVGKGRVSIAGNGNYSLVNLQASERHTGHAPASLSVSPGLYIAKTEGSEPVKVSVPSPLIR